VSVNDISKCKLLLGDKWNQNIPSIEIRKSWIEKLVSSKMRLDTTTTQDVIIITPGGGRVREKKNWNPPKKKTEKKRQPNKKKHKRYVV
jgi:hypothetical protein